MRFNKQRLPLLVPLLLGLSLVACGHDDDDDEDTMPEPVMVSYQVTVTNLTAGQPFSPVALIAHSTGDLWQVGEPASEALALMAEGGDNSELMALDAVLAADSGEEPLMPGDSLDLTVSLEAQSSLLLSVATMLVNTNDGFTGVNAWDVSALNVGDVMAISANVYDAGTEPNSEMAGTIPGPADGGDGLSEGREVQDVVTMHPGVVTQPGGLSHSVLMAEHRFDNPAVKITVQRLE